MSSVTWPLGILLISRRQPGNQPRSPGHATLLQGSHPRPADQRCDHLGLGGPWLRSDPDALRTTNGLAPWAASGAPDDRHRVGATERREAHPVDGSKSRPSAPTRRRKRPIRPFNDPCGGARTPPIREPGQTPGDALTLALLPKPGVITVRHEQGPAARLRKRRQTPGAARDISLQ